MGTVVREDFPGGTIPRFPEPQCERRSTVPEEGTRGGLGSGSLILRKGASIGVERGKSNLRFQ